jgi:hypothetical protein
MSKRSGLVLAAARAFLVGATRPELELRRAAVGPDCRE